MRISSFEKYWQDKFSEAALKPQEHYDICLETKEGVKAKVDYFFRYLKPYIQDDNSHTLVLDIGCGPGIFSRGLAQLGYQVYGIDYSEAMIEVAKKATVEENIHYQVGDIYAIPFPDNKFDMIICLAVFQSVEHVEDAIAEIRSKLKPHGLLIVLTLNRLSLASLVHAVMGRKKGPQPRKFNPYTFRELFLKNNAFDKIRMRGIYVFPRFLSWITWLIAHLHVYRLLNAVWFVANPLSHYLYIEARKSENTP